MTDSELTAAADRARDFLAATLNLVTELEHLDEREHRRLSFLRQSRSLADDLIRAVDMVTAERSARRSIQEQRDEALSRILAREETVA